MALLMALDAHKRGAVEVVAITAVCGNTGQHHAARNILRTLGRVKIVQDIVIISMLLQTVLAAPASPSTAGLRRPWWCPTPTTSTTTVLYCTLYCTVLYCTGLDGFNDVTLETAEPDMGRVRGERAWEVMSRLSRAHPGQVGARWLLGRV